VSGRFLISVQRFGPPDSHHLDAAVGWLGLGSVNEARSELDLISAAHKNHPAVLEARWTICAHEKQWAAALDIALREIAAAPDDASGWLHRAYALRRLPDGGLARAWEALLPASEKFPREPVIAYNLSCYACQLQQPDLARRWLKRAMKIGGQDAIRKMALADDDLKPLWTEIEKLQ
jgi:predicted Zn-dependent protease